MVGICLCSGQAAAATQLADSASFDWVGWLEESTLPDNSVLFEYSARTLSGSTQGALLAVSFVPRFDCRPAISARLPSAVQDSTLASALELSIDDQSLTFDIVREEDGDFTVFSLIASDDQIEQLLQTINEALRATISPVVSNQNERPAVVKDVVDNSAEGFSEPPGSVNFSLLGSTTATEMTRIHCYLHEPVVYEQK